MDTYLAITSKRDQRRYADRPVPVEVERRILDAGRVSGNSQNRQEWEFVVVSDHEAVAEAVYAPHNVRTAALVVAIVAKRAFDAGRAAQNMMLAAWNEGIGSCPNGTPDPAAVGELLGLEAGEEPAIILTFGYPARPVDPESRSPEEWIERANRKPFDEVVKSV